MYQSRFYVESYPKATLMKKLSSFLQKHTKVYCRALRRNVSLLQFPQVIAQRNDAKRRLQCFTVAVDILKNSPDYSIQYEGKKKCFERYGKDIQGKKVFLHIREEEAQYVFSGCIKKTTPT